MASGLCRLFAAAGVALVLAADGLSGAAAPAVGRGDDDRLRQLTGIFAAFDARDLAGRRWTASSLAGRVVVVDFWATWCAPCLADLPWLRRLHERGAGRSVQVLGVSLDVGERRTLVAWLNRQRVDWPQIWDDRGYGGGLARQFGITTLPASILVAPDGRVVAVNLRAERLVAAIDALQPY